VKAFLMLAALLLFAAPAMADDPAEGEMPPMGKPAEMDALAWYHGEWDVAMEFKMDPASEEWTEGVASAVSKPELNGCANRMDFTGEIMGTPFHGFDYTTWNREYQRYESVWMDDMQAKMSVMHGQLVGSVLTMEGPDKMEGHEFINRATAENKSDDEVYWVMSMSFDGGETWTDHMRMTYTRKK
jgi:hypothetical protein